MHLFRLNRKLPLFFAAVLEISECLRVCGADCNGDVQRQLPRRSRHDRRDAGSAPAGESLGRHAERRAPVRPREGREPRAGLPRARRQCRGEGLS